MFSGLLLTIIGALFMLGIVGCDNGTTNTTITQYTVTFDANGGEVVPSTMTAEEGKTLSSLPTPTKTSGDTFFQGWYTKDGTNNDWGEPFGVLTPIVTDITVYAKWGSVAPTKHTVTFDPEGGTVNPTSIQVNSGDPVGALPVPEKANNIFEGWYTKDGTNNDWGEPFGVSTPIVTSITVYAKWTTINSNPKKISITGLSDFNGKRIEVGLFATQNPISNNELIAYHFVLSELIANGKREELPLYTNIAQSQPWTGFGSYYVSIIIRRDDHTNHNEAAFMSKNKIAFNATTTVVGFSLTDFYRRTKD
jgi:hypothetical protein